VRHVACFAHRAEAQRLSGITEAQQNGLARGREKGTNHRAGYRHKEESKQKISASNKAFWAAHPGLARERGAKTRGPLHPAWKGGPKRLNLSVRGMTEYRRWADAVKFRDGACTDCGSTVNLEADHVVGLAILLVWHGVRNREDARACPALWDVNNGRTFCEACHYKRHGRTPPRPIQRVCAASRLCEVCGGKFSVKPSQLLKGHGRFCGKACASAAQRKSLAGESNPNYRGGKVKVVCRFCRREFEVKPAVYARGGGRYCSRGCVRADRRGDLQAAPAAPSGALH
jgi:hypothetical protein